MWTFSPLLVGTKMNNLKNLNTLIKIEPNAEYYRVNDGGFEALLDEFIPDNEDVNMKGGHSENSTRKNLLPDEPENDQSNSEEVKSLEQVNSDLMVPTIVPPPDVDLQSKESTQENDTQEAAIESRTPNITPDRQINNFSGVNNDPRKFKVDLKKKRRRTKRSIARAAALVSANGELSKLTVPITITKDPTKKAYDSMNGTCEVVIISNDYPETKLSEEQYHIVQDQFIEAMMNDSSLHADSWCPRFINCFLKDGAIHFICMDITARHWIVATLPKLKLWPDAKLISVDAANLLMLTRVVGWIKRVTLENAEILKLLEKQNEGLSTSKWVIYDRSEPNEKGVRFIFGIDEESIKVLREIKGKPFIGLGRAQLTLPPLEKHENSLSKPINAYEKPVVNNNKSILKLASSLNKTVGTNAAAKSSSFVTNLNNAPNLNIRPPMVNSAMPNLNIRPINRPFTPLMQARTFNIGCPRMNPTTRYPNPPHW